MRKYLPPFLILLFFCAAVGEGVAEEALTWDDCIREAAKNNPDLISSAEGVKESAANKRIAASGLLPQINSNVNAATARSATGTTTDTYSYGISGTQLLFDGIKTINDVKAASENVKAAQHSYKFTSSEVRLRLRTAFINMLKAQELLNITQEIFNIRRGNLELITLRYESGLEHKGALLTAEANLAQAQFEVSQAGRASEVAQRELMKEMGRQQFSLVRVTGGFAVSNAALEKPDFAVLADNNPYLGKLIAQKNAAAYNLKGAAGNFLPQLSGRVSTEKSSAHWPPEDEGWNAGLTLSFPIFEGGLKLAELAQAKALLNQAQANERSTKDGVILTLEQYWAGLQDAIETVEVQRKFLAAAEERARIAEAQYSLGLIQFDNWTIIEDDLVRTKKAFLNAQANALLAEANWILAKGETLEYAQK
jgi:outer membrane protein TolC